MTIDEYVADMKARIAAAQTLEDVAAVERAADRIFEMNVPGTIRVTVRFELFGRIAARTRELLG